MCSQVRRALIVLIQHNAVKVIDVSCIRITCLLRLLNSTLSLAVYQNETCLSQDPIAISDGKSKVPELYSLDVENVRCCTKWLCCFRVGKHVLDSDEYLNRKIIPLPP